MSLESLECESFPRPPHLSQFGEYFTEIASKWWNVSEKGREFLLCFRNGVGHNRNLSFFASKALPFKRSWFSWVWGNSSNIKLKKLSDFFFWLIHAYFFVAFWNKYCSQRSSFCFSQSGKIFSPKTFSNIWTNGISLNKWTQGPSTFLTRVNILFLGKLANSFSFWFAFPSRWWNNIADITNIFNYLKMMKQQKSSRNNP